MTLFSWVTSQSIAKSTEIVGAQRRRISRRLETGVAYSMNGMTSGIGNSGMTNIPATVSAPTSNGIPTTA